MFWCSSLSATLWPTTFVITYLQLQNREVSSDVIIHKFTNCSKTPESKVCHLEQQTTEHTYIPDKDNATGKSARGKARATFTWQFLANWAVYATLYRRSLLRRYYSIFHWLARIWDILKC